MTIDEITFDEHDEHDDAAYERSRAFRLEAELAAATTRAERAEARAEAFEGHADTLRAKIDTERASAERAEAQRDEARRRIGDLKFAMGEEAGWFDRFTRERTRASGAELLYRDAAGQVDALRAEVERLLADKDTATIEASQAIGRAERAEFNEEAQGRTLRAIVHEMRNHHPNGVGIVDAISRLVERVEVATAEVERLREKAIRFDLDAAGIEQREREAVELVEKRAEVERLTKERDEARVQLGDLGREAAKHLDEKDVELATLRAVAHALGVCHCWDYGCEPGDRESLVRYAEAYRREHDQAEELWAEVVRLTKERDEATHAGELVRILAERLRSQLGTLRAAAERVVDEYTRWSACDGIATLASIRAAVDALSVALGGEEVPRGDV